MSTEPRMKITKDKYESLKIEQSFLQEYSFIEQKYDLLIENYIEFETSLLSSAMRNMVQHRIDPMYFGEQRLLVTRRVSNLLSSCRLYIDHTAHHLGTIGKKKYNFKPTFVRLTNEKYDENIEYQTMEALRNYCQHRGFPVHAISFGMKWDELENLNEPKTRIRKGHLAFFVTPILDAWKLKNDKRFKPSVMNHLEQKKYDEINLMLFIRKYIELVSAIHQKIRDQFQSDVLTAQNLILDTIASFSRRTKVKKPEWVQAIALATDGTERESPVYLSSRLVEYVVDIQKRNHEVANLHRRYVTNRAQ